MSKFSKAVFKYFETKIPEGCVQRIDAIECFSDLSKFWFWRIRLHRMAKKRSNCP